MKSRTRLGLTVTLITLALLSIWVTRDLTDRRRHDLRAFDGHEVARLETAMWRSYYDHQRLQLFRELAELLRQQYHLPFWQSNVAAYHAAHAAVVFQRGHERTGYLRALPDLQNFYSRIQQHSTTPFDVGKVAQLELEWWIIRRERAQHLFPADLERALAQLQAQIYARPISEFQNHAKARAAAMLLRDARAAGGGSPSEQDWRTIGTLLDQAWVDLQTVVSSSPHVPRDIDD